VAASKRNPARKRFLYEDVYSKFKSSVSQVEKIRRILEIMQIASEIAKKM
jgi:hypothetical protein